MKTPGKSEPLDRSDTLAHIERLLGNLHTFGPPDSTAEVHAVLIKARDYAEAGKLRTAVRLIGGALHLLDELKLKGRGKASGQ